MIDQTQALTSASDAYCMAKTIIDLWDTYRTHVVIAFAIVLLLTIVFVIRKSHWGTWFLFLAIILGLSIPALDGFKLFVHKKKREAIMCAITAPVTQTIGRVIKGIFNFGR